jgi:hypothetical protein
MKTTRMTTISRREGMLHSFENMESRNPPQHADNLEGSQVGRKECESGDPARQRTPGKEEVLPRLHVLLQCIPDEDRDENAPPMIR